MAAKCWDLGYVLGKLPLTQLFVVAALFILSFVFSFRGVILTFFMRKVFGNVKTVLLFSGATLLSAFLLKFLLGYFAVRFMVGTDTSIFKGRDVKILGKREEDSKIYLAYTFDGYSVFEAVLKKDGDSFKILDSKRFVKRLEDGKFKRNKVKRDEK